jgi:hypothetical protein
VVEGCTGMAAINQELRDRVDGHVADAGNRPHGRALAEHLEDLGALSMGSLFMPMIMLVQFFSFHWCRFGGRSHVFRGLLESLIHKSLIGSRKSLYGFAECMNFCGHGFINFTQFFRFI